MNGRDVAEILFAEFELKEFLTRDISPETMERVIETMGITETNRHSRNTRVGRGIGSMDGAEYALESGINVTMVVTRPENGSLPRRFKFASQVYIAT